MDDKIKGLFPITQAAAVCGISRSTLLRMEEKGLLIPAYIAPKSGRRYYDNDNINRILHVQQLQQEWELCTGIYQNRHRRELQEQIKIKNGKIL